MIDAGRREPDDADVCVLIVVKFFILLGVSPSLHDYYACARLLLPVGCSGLLTISCSDCEFVCFFALDWVFVPVAVDLVERKGTGRGVANLFC